MHAAVAWRIRACHCHHSSPNRWRCCQLVWFPSLLSHLVLSLSLSRSHSLSLPFALFLARLTLFLSFFLIRFLSFLLSLCQSVFTISSLFLSISFPLSTLELVHPEKRSLGHGPKKKRVRESVKKKEKKMCSLFKNPWTTTVRKAIKCEGFILI